MANDRYGPDRNPRRRLSSDFYGNPDYELDYPGRDLPRDRPSPYWDSGSDYHEEPLYPAYGSGMAAAGARDWGRGQSYYSHDRYGPRSLRGGRPAGPERRDNRDRSPLDKASDEVSSWFGDEDAERRREADHRGKGPRGYKRDDNRIREDVNDALTSDPDVDASDIEVSVSDGEVTLSGEVDSKYAKRCAEDCADHVAGVHDVQNTIRVRRTTGSSDLSSSTPV